MLAFPAAALGGTNLLPGETREPRGARPPPPPPTPPRDAAHVRAAGGDAPAAPGLGVCVLRALRSPSPPGPGPPGPARRAAGAPPAAARTPSAAAAPLRLAGAPRPEPAPGGGEASAHLERRRRRRRRRRGGGTHTHDDDDDGARRSAPCRGLCLRCHMGRGAGFKRVSAGHAVSGAPQPCPQRQRSARPGMRL